MASVGATRVLRSAGRMPGRQAADHRHRDGEQQDAPVEAACRDRCVAAPPVNIDSSRSRPHAATISPSAPPTNDSIMVSTRSWRTTRQRPAPSAVRTAISRSRALARATSRLATLPQVIASSTPTIASSTKRRDGEIAAQERHAAAGAGEDDALALELGAIVGVRRRRAAWPRRADAGRVSAAATPAAFDASGTRANSDEPLDARLRRPRLRAVGGASSMLALNA